MKDTTDEDCRYWKVLSDLVPEWSLMGWTFRQSATYVTPGHWGPMHEDTINVTGRQRDDLVKCLTEKASAGETWCPSCRAGTCGVHGTRRGL